MPARATAGVRIRVRLRTRLLKTGLCLGVDSAGIGQEQPEAGLAGRGPLKVA